MDNDDICNVKFKKVHPNAKLPERAKPGDSGFDVYAVEEFFLGAGLVVKARTGLQVADIKPGFEIQVRSRSGLAAGGVMITNSPGTVDNGYRGEICVLLTSIEDDFFFKKGERIAQLVIQRVPNVTMEWVEEVSNTERGANGFNSTGK